MSLRCFANISLIICVMIICTNGCVRALSMEALRNAVKPMRNNCINQSGVNSELLDGMPRGEFPEEEAFQCYIKCVMTALKSLKDGKPVLNALLRQIKLGLPKGLQPRAVEATIYCCENVDFDEDVCVASWQFIKCTYEKNPNDFFFP